MNLEEYLVEEFGASQALGDELAISLQFSKLIPSEKRRVARVLATDAARSVTEYVQTFRGALPSTVLNSMKYSFNVYLVPRVVNRANAADAAVQFMPLDEANHAELERMEKLNVLIKEKHIPIANLNMYRPSEVTRKVARRIPFQFRVIDHTQAWKYFGVRPRSGNTQPERTRSEYCVYDRIHKDYLYTQAWVERLVEELQDHRRYYEVIGRRPKRPA